MTDQELAVELIDRLNELLTDDEFGEPVRALLDTIMGTLFRATGLLPHPTIQVWAIESLGACGWLGLLNGIVGSQTAGAREGWGWIAAVCDDETHALIRFELALPRATQ